MIFIHNAVTKMHKRNWGHNLTRGNSKSSHRWQKRCQFLQHISSHVKFGITYYHYYHIRLIHLSVITGMVLLYMDEAKLHIHVIYILWLNLFYVFYLLYLLYPISFSSLSDDSSFGSLWYLSTVTDMKSCLSYHILYTCNIISFPNK